MIDAATAEAAGIAGVFAKATEGGGAHYRYANPDFVQQYTGGVAAGLQVVGAYHCLSGDDVAAQIGYFRGRLDGVPRPPGTAYMIDVEPFAELRTAGVLPRFSDVEAFCDAWARLPGGPLAMYLPRWVWMQMGQPSLAGLPGQVLLWSSNYPANKNLPPAELYTVAGGDSGPGWTAYGGLEPALWQFGSTALIPGIRAGRGGADISAFRGTIDDLGRLFAGATFVSTHPQGDPVLQDWTNVKKGATGPAARVVEGLLVAKGLAVGCDANHLDGIIGPVCDESIRAFQSANGLTVDGVVGPHTLSTLIVGRDVA